MTEKPLYSKFPLFRHKDYYDEYAEYHLSTLYFLHHKNTYDDSILNFTLGTCNKTYQTHK